MPTEFVNSTLALVFTNPALWVGALALAVPFVLHLLTRKTSRMLMFPTVRFIRKVQASQSAIYRLRHLLLLLVRTVFLALLLLAFLKPVLQTHSPSADERGESRHAVVLVLDASASMGYAQGGSSPFVRARLAGEKILDELHETDVADLVMAAAAPAASFDAPTDNRFHLKNDLRAARLTQERADLDAAIAEAVKQLAKVAGFKKEIHLLSDFQRGNWASVDFTKIPADVRLVFVSVAAPEAGNLAITDVILQPPAPARGEEVEVSCKVANYTRLAKSVPVQLKFGGEKPMQHELDVPAGTTASVTFRLRANRAGFFEGELTIPEDSLPVDNRRYFTLTVGERVQVLVLSDEDRADPGASHRFLARAINPGPETGGAFAPVALTPAQFDKFSAAGAQLVILSGVNELSSATSGTLINYLKDGGAIIYFLSGPADRINLATLAKIAGEDLRLPFRPGNFIDRAAGNDGSFATLTEANFDYPMLKPFKEGRDLGEIHVQRYFGTEREPGQGQVLLRYDDRNIALARKSVGAGSLLLANFSAALHNSDLAKRTVFVPFLHEMIKGMRPQSGAVKPFAVGQPASATVTMRGANRDVRFASPSGARLDAVFEMGRDEAAVIFPETKESGFYRVLVGDQLAGSVAVNVDPRESNLESLSLAQITALSEISRERVFATAGLDVQALKNLRAGRPVWHYCLLGALCLLGLEQALTLIWRK